MTLVMTCKDLDFFHRKSEVKQISNKKSSSDYCSGELGALRRWRQKDPKWSVKKKDLYPLRSWHHNEMKQLYRAGHFSNKKSGKLH